MYDVINNNVYNIMWNKKFRIYIVYLSNIGYSFNKSR